MHLSVCPILKETGRDDISRACANSLHLLFENDLRSQ